MIVGITGHRRRPNIDWKWVRAAIRSRLRACSPPLVGCTCLAAGADQMFADVVLKLGGALDVVIPFPDYEATFEQQADVVRLRKQLALAASVTTLEPSRTREEGYLKAGKTVVDRSGLLFAVWDGKPAQGKGGSAEIVAYALKCGKPIMHLDGELKLVRSMG